MGNTF